MVRATALLTFVALAMSPAAEAGPAAVDRQTAAYLDHTRTGAYQAFRLLPRDWQTPFEVDRSGVPLVNYSFGRAYNPTTTAQYGLASWTLGRLYNDRRRIRTALRMADWLVQTQQRSTGKWLYRFELEAPGAGFLPSPWASALAQGQALSLLRRAYQRTRDSRYLRAARRGVRPFRVHVGSGGLMRRLRGGPFYEEYPIVEAPHLVLNGFMQSLLGLHDLADVSHVAGRRFRAGMRSLPQVLPLYDLGAGQSSYSLAHLQWSVPAQPASPSYHQAHVGLLRLLDRIRPTAALAAYARAWSAG
jgi:D-glucuronyl C5-epimerase C-terminus